MKIKRWQHIQVRSEDTAENTCHQNRITAQARKHKHVGSEKRHVRLATTSRNMCGEHQWGRVVQHGGPPGWLEKSDPASVILYVMDGRTASFFRTVPIALTGAAQLRADGGSSCCYIINVHNHPSWATSRKDGKARYFSRPDVLSSTLM